MMYEHQPEQDVQRQVTARETQLEQRLHAYYGPVIKEQPLARASWHDVQRKLGSQQQPYKRIDWKHLFRRRGEQPIPEYVRAAFVRVSYETRLLHPLPTLQCAFKPGAPPVAHMPFRLKPYICLTLPSSVSTEIEGAVLDTLLATALARHRLSWRGSALVMYLTCLSPALLGLLVLSFYRGPYLLVSMVLLVLLFLLAMLVLSRFHKHICLSGDALAVLWLGRERVCQGLHGLVNYQRMPDHDRWWRWERWRTPSLAERIERVCSTHSTIYDERLTLVR